MGRMVVLLTRGERRLKITFSPFSPHIYYYLSSIPDLTFNFFTSNAITYSDNNLKPEEMLFSEYEWNFIL